MIFQLLDQLVRAASTVAAEQVPSTVSYSHHALPGRGKQLKALSKILTESSVRTKLMPRLILWNRT